ncbi:carbohydrate ABC transporter ATP-binding protein (CUT1 family) [Plasticicumulans lactativorans]|uniref:Carbohydrate ABC transporter ATP-binding protein (CUT1 family) n=1 Tax=Plasticicumulans lactativorans TaxID=1133106 RepID=A0A4R2LAU9_9GAMM|nr:ABC transporter ATP-binding protein [Plasticicumulans lactativorans]TCO82610.1 carbohydrate ABC transporter ATP-binding protein (CUT1 family) [Plasticicumulans lactativorans]
MSALEIRKVNKRYGSVHVLKEIDLSIESGEFLILVGPSGCGKSTLMNAIAGLDEISDGSIHIGGRDVTHVGPKDRDIAMVFQSYALYPSMNVAENIAFGLEMRGVDKARRAQEVARVAKLLQIDHLLERKPAALSGGQRQRVAMGRALARQPQIYLFDEPLSNLDAKLRVEMRTEIKKLHQRLGTTIVYVTHDQIEAMTLANRIAVMKDGVLQQFATPQQIYDEPVNMFVAGFMGSPAMNFIRTRVVRAGSHYGVSVRNGAGRDVVLPLPERGNGLSAWVDREVVLGLRPEQITHVTPHRLERPLVTELPCTVEVAEPTGPDTLILIRMNDQEVAARIEPHAQAPVGSPMPLAFDMSKAVLFDPATQQRCH